MKAMILARAKALGCSVDLANNLRTARLIDLAVDQAQRDAAKAQPDSTVPRHRQLPTGRA